MANGPVFRPATPEDIKGNEEITNIPIFTLKLGAGNESYGNVPTVWVENGKARKVSVKQAKALALAYEAETGEPWPRSAKTPAIAANQLLAMGMNNMSFNRENLMKGRRSTNVVDLTSPTLLEHAQNTLNVTKAGAMEVGRQIKEYFQGGKRPVSEEEVKGHVIQQVQKRKK